MTQAIPQSQKTLWESFQKLLGVQQPQVAEVGETPQANTNPFAPEFLEGLKKFGANQNKVQATPFQTPAQESYAQGFGGQGRASLPQDSYAAHIQNMIASYRR